MHVELRAKQHNDYPHILATTPTDHQIDEIRPGNWLVVDTEYGLFRVMDEDFFDDCFERVVDEKS